LQRDNEASLEALQNFRRKMAMTNKAENARVRTPETPGIRNERRGTLGKDRREAPVAPKTAGAAKPGADTSKSPVANRDMEGPRRPVSHPSPPTSRLLMLEAQGQAVTHKLFLGFAAHGILVD
jgi:hypothetical protein